MARQRVICTRGNGRFEVGEYYNLDEDNRPILPSKRNWAMIAWDDPRRQEPGYAQFKMVIGKGNFVVDQYTIPGVRSTQDELLAYAKKHYPIGTKFRTVPYSAYSSYQLEEIRTVAFTPKFCTIGEIEGTGFGYIYKDGVWAEIIKDEPVKAQTPTEKPLWKKVKCIRSNSGSYTVGKVYEVLESGHIKDNGGYSYMTMLKYTSTFSGESYPSNSDFEEYIEPIVTPHKEGFISKMISKATADGIDTVIPSRVHSMFQDYNSTILPWVVLEAQTQARNTSGRYRGYMGSHGVVDEVVHARGMSLDQINKMYFPDSDSPKPLLIKEPEEHKTIIPNTKGLNLSIK